MVGPAAAVPVTDALLERYASWLIKEHMAVQKVRMLRAAPTNTARGFIMGGGIDQNAYGYRVRPDVIAHVASADPATRAALVLSAANVL